jgi:hypothetical protein
MPAEQLNCPSHFLTTEVQLQIHKHTYLQATGNGDTVGQYETKH